MHRPGDREIRVLELLPRIQAVQIQCEIRVVSLDGDEHFEALSYVWGDRTQERQITISGHRFQVTHNLYAALSRLRQSTMKRTIWIDQLCINQTDNDERARQVAMMRDIYTKCSCCVIWLGEVDDTFDIKDAAEVFAFIRIAGETTTFRNINLPVLFEDSEHGRRVRMAFKAFSMYGNPWWSRIWTIQEAIVPRSATIIWGPLSLPRDLVLRAAHTLRGDRMHSLFPQEFCIKRVKHTPLLRRLLYPVHGFHHSKYEDGALDLLMRWRHRDATDVRDKVYALLGLVPSYVLPSAIGCSYDISASTLFEHVTLDLIRDERGLRPLLGSTEMPHVTPGLATWAIDFACTNWVEKRQLKWWTHSHRYKEFSADGGNKVTFSTSACGKALALTGLYVDDVRYVGSVYTLSDRDAIDTQAVLKVIDSAWLLLQQARSSQALHQNYINGHTWQTAFQRTMIGDLIMEEFPIERADDNIAELYESLLDTLRSQSKNITDEHTNQGANPNHEVQDVETHHEHYLGLQAEQLNAFVPRNILYESLRGMIPNHVFFITKAGYIGIGPPSTQPGDQVWIFYGGQVPFVMRMADSTRSADEHRDLHLVGDAYVHGVMDGEVARDGQAAQTVWIS